MLPPVWLTPQKFCITKLNALPSSTQEKSMPLYNASELLMCILIESFILMGINLRCWVPRALSRKEEWVQVGILKWPHRLLSTWRQWQMEEGQNGSLPDSELRQQSFPDAKAVVPRSVEQVMIKVQHFWSFGNVLFCVLDGVFMSVCF